MISQRIHLDLSPYRSMSLSKACQIIIQIKVAVISLLHKICGLYLQHLSYIDKSKRDLFYKINITFGLSLLFYIFELYI